MKAHTIQVALETRRATHHLLLQACLHHLTCNASGGRGKLTSGTRQHAASEMTYQTLEQPSRMKRNRRHTIPSVC
jgi:hypothetical protein